MIKLKQQKKHGKQLVPRTENQDSHTTYLTFNYPYQDSHTTYLTFNYPYDSQQTGPEYFKTARKCGLFGVCNDGGKKQILYLIDEAETPGKGADCIISLVHRYIEKHGCGEKTAYLHAENWSK